MKYEAFYVGLSQNTATLSIYVAILIIIFPTGETILSPPVVLKSPQTIFAQRLMEVVFECDVSGNPEPFITWYKDGLEIIGATQRTLIIAEVALLDRAAYSCTASNDLGNVTSNPAYLNIRGYNR